MRGGRWRRAILGALLGSALGPAVAAGCDDPFLLEDRSVVLEPCTAIIDKPGTRPAARARAYEFRGRAHRLLNHREAAWADNERGLALLPNDPGLLVLRAAQKWAEGDFRGAYADALRTQELAPGNLRSLNILIAVSMAAGRLDVAGEWLDRARSVDPDAVAIGIQRMEYWRARGDVGQAIAAAERVLASDRVLERKSRVYLWFGRPVATDLWLLFELAKLHRQHGAYDRSRLTAERAVALKRDATTLTERGMDTFGRPVHFGENFDAEALADFDAALALDPDYPRALGMRGQVLQLMKRPDEALVFTDRAIEKGGSRDLLWQRGRILRDLGRSDEAYTAFGAYALTGPNALSIATGRLRQVGLFSGDNPADGPTPAFLDGLRACSIDARCW